MADTNVILELAVKCVTIMHQVIAGVPSSSFDSDRQLRLCFVCEVLVASTVNIY
jgi:hypothetical protein